MYTLKGLKVSKLLNIEPVNKVRTTKEIVYLQLKESIFKNDIPHDMILTETLLAETLNTSRTPVREAVADLVKEGLLQLIPRKGIKVREISESEKEQIIFLRTVIELEGYKNICEKLDEKIIADFYDLIEQQKQCVEDKNPIVFIELDQQFHFKPIRIAELFFLEEVLLNMYDLTRLIGHKALYKEGRMAEVIEEHTAIVKALEERNFVKIEEKLLEHLHRTQSSVLKNN